MVGFCTLQSRPTKVSRPASAADARCRRSPIPTFDRMSRRPCLVQATTPSTYLAVIQHVDHGIANSTLTSASSSRYPPCLAPDQGTWMSVKARPQPMGSVTPSFIFIIFEKAIGKSEHHFLRRPPSGCRLQRKVDRDRRTGPLPLPRSNSFISSIARRAHPLLPRCMLADRGYDADWIRAFATERGAWANVPPRCNRREPICFSPYLYRARNLVERFFNKIKQCRRVATRYDKLAANYLAFIQLASIRLWLRVL